MDAQYALAVWELDRALDEARIQSGIFLETYGSNLAQPGRPEWRPPAELWLETFHRLEPVEPSIRHLSRDSAREWLSREVERVEERRTMQLGGLTITGQAVSSGLAILFLGVAVLLWLYAGRAVELRAFEDEATLRSTSWVLAFPGWRGAQTRLALLFIGPTVAILIFSARAHQAEWTLASWLSVAALPPCLGAWQLLEGALKRER